MTRYLRDFATARSGDKGNHANLGVIATSGENYALLREALTEHVVADFFQPIGVTRVERFELPGCWGLNFVLYDALDGGASQSLRIDTQGKLLGTAALDIPIP